MAEQLFHSTGKRKTAVARVWMRPGDGEITINKKPLEKYLPRESDRVVVLAPLEATGLVDKFTFKANVSGGGVCAQAGAIRHGLSRALVTADPELRDTLKKAGFLTRDSRMKERKKYGQPGARARYQYSKR
ncbi:MAG: 30S ribosomal protein S9 [Deltaproteobacteria bacterium]|nr:30S ribosomal protein S9 [Deltaproteobacteria bacterium]MCF8118900.1 30S ribosomal protein S9 [Deltaproteobacteria bacterium]